ncbi:RNA polymerase sigma-70 factor (ECF subfamily) [Phenylobacterium haematophilum]|uniref:RNA polymerase sigma-70 factor (ECF subfamily) n=1 Tax=Phenylobacterium haematophilum TaxID=98513 RepID=A0A840A132_9CAUL|nr:sigma-70 family RNA polymerase sigma factor [Phenylobacterium haematophilum]MBB3891699.1 RNA polymerase sigma-70 factor (ECF subfamily) [Phenylobacterium haematophilum]
MIQIFPRTVLGSMHGEARSFASSAKRVGAMTTDADDTLFYDRLIEAVALRRDREAFSQLFEHFAPRLKAWLMKSGTSAAAAEDFAQDVMLTAWRKADLFDARKARAATWIFTIARNRRIDALRRDARALPMPQIDLAEDDLARPDDLLVMADDAERVREAMSRLNPDQVEVLRLAFFLDSPHSEIAQRLDLPLGTVKSRIRNAMIKLRRILEPSEEASQ